MSDVDNKVKMIVEGLLMAAGRPLSLDNIIQVFSDDEKPDRDELKTVLQYIADECDDRGFELKEVASGYRFQVKQDLSEWVAKLWEERPPRYTRALLETLALVAYRQPITRGDIEEIRGVGVSSNIVRTLLDREWIRVVGHRDVPGRPAMFATTKGFLDYFNLKNLQDLPPLSEIKELEQRTPELDLNDDLINSRVLELPEDAVDESSFEMNEAEKAELIAEEEAVALSQKPLDEILNRQPERDEEKHDHDLDEEQDEEQSEPLGEQLLEDSAARDDSEQEEAAEDSAQSEASSNDDEILLTSADDSQSTSVADAQDDGAQISDDGSEIESGNIDFAIEDDAEEATD